MLAAPGARFTVLDRRRQALLGELETLGDTALSFRPAPGAWSILEVVHHLVLVEQGIMRAAHDGPAQPGRRRNLRERVGCAAVWLVFKLGLRVKIPTNRVRPQPGLCLSRLKQEWAACRTSLEAYLDSTPASKLNETMFGHPIGGPMNVEQTLLFLTRHFDHHRRQIDRIRRSGRSPLLRLLRGVGLAVVMSVMVVGCSRDAGGTGSAAALEAAVQKSMSLMSGADWEAAYDEVLTRNQRAACSLAEYAERENTGLSMIRDSLGEGEISIIELNAEVVGNVGLVTGTAVYTTRLSGQVGVEGQVTGADLRARRNLGTATAENPDYWIFEDGGWRWLQRRPDSPCYNEADMELIRAASQAAGSDSPD